MTQTLAELVKDLRRLQKAMQEDGYIKSQEKVEKAASIIEAFAKVPLTYTLEGAPYPTVTCCHTCHFEQPAHADDCPVAALHKTLEQMGVRL